MIWQTADPFLPQFTEKHDIKVSVNDIVIKAVAVALKNVAEANGKIYIFYTMFRKITQKYIWM